MKCSYPRVRLSAALILAVGLSVSWGYAQATSAPATASDYFDFFQEKTGVQLYGTPTKQGVYSLDRVLQCVPESLPSGIQLVNFDLAAKEGSVRPVGRDRCALTMGPTADPREVAKLTGLSLYRANPGLGDYFAKKVPARADQVQVSPMGRFADSFVDRVVGVPEGRQQAGEAPEAAAFWDQFKVDHGQPLEPEFPAHTLPEAQPEETARRADAGTGSGVFGVQ